MWFLIFLISLRIRCFLENCMLFWRSLLRITCIMTLQQPFAKWRKSGIWHILLEYFKVKSSNQYEDRFLLNNNAKMSRLYTHLQPDVLWTLNIETPFSRLPLEQSNILKARMWILFILTSEPRGQTQNSDQEKKTFTVKNVWWSCVLL